MIDSEAEGGKRGGGTGVTERQKGRFVFLSGLKIDCERGFFVVVFSPFSESFGG